MDFTTISIWLSFLLTSSFAQQFVVNQLTSGTTVSRSLAATTTPQDAQSVLDYFVIDLPFNVKSLTIGFEPDPLNNKECGMLYFFYSARGLPCGNLENEPDYTTTPCRYTGFGGGYNFQTAVVYPGQEGVAENNLFESGAPFYVSVGKSSQFFDKMCHYTLNVTLENCTSSQAAVATALYVDPVCVEVDDHTFPLNTQITFNSTVLYRMPVTSVDQYISIEATSTSESGSFRAAGAYHYAAAGSTKGDCFDQSFGDTISLSCFLPKKGWFYMAFYKGSDGSANVEAQISVTQKPLAVNVFNINSTNFSTYKTLKANYSMGDPIPSDFYFVDFPAGTIANVKATFCMGDCNYVKVSYRKDGYPSATIRYNTQEMHIIDTGECWTFVIRPEDTYVGGRFSFGMHNPSSSNAEYHLTVVTTYPIPTLTTASTTASGTSPTQNGLGSGEIAGIVIGSTLLVVLGVGLITFFVRRRKRSSYKSLLSPKEDQ